MPPEGGESEHDRQLRQSEIELALGAAIAGHEHTAKRSLTRSEHGAWRDVISQLVDVDATGDEVRERCQAYRQAWPNMTLTPHALVRHWTTLGGFVAATRIQLEQIEFPVDDDPSRFLLGNPKLHAWMASYGCGMPEGDCRIVLEDNWKLAGEQLERALEKRAELAEQRAAADAIVRAAIDAAAAEAA